MARGKDVLAAIDQSASLRSRSLLSEWMRTNYEGFKSRLDERVPNWAVLTDLFDDAGLTDRFGNKPTPASARKLWLRIRKEMASKPAPRPRSAPQPVLTIPPASDAPLQTDETERVLAEMRAQDRRIPSPKK